MGVVSPALWLAVIAGVALHFTGEFINTTGPHKDSDFFYAALQYTF